MNISNLFFFKGPLKIARLRPPPPPPKPINPIISNKPDASYAESANNETEKKIDKSEISEPKDFQHVQHAFLSNENFKVLKKLKIKCYYNNKNVINLQFYLVSNDEVSNKTKQSNKTSSNESMTSCSIFYIPTQTQTNNDNSNNGKAKINDELKLLFKKNILSLKYVLFASYEQFLSRNKNTS